MKRWQFGVLREETADGVPVSGGQGGGTKGEAAKTFNVNGKDIPIEILSAALNLHNSLSDPVLGKEIIGTLASNLGLLDKKGDVKDTDKAQDKLEGRLTKLLKSKLGKDYEKFADTLGPIMDEGIQEYLNEHKTTAEAASHETGWSGEVEKFTDNHTLTADVETKMQEIITRSGGVPRGLKGKAAQEYLSDMYELAVKRLGGIVREVEGDDEEETPRGRRTRRGRPEFREVERPKGPLSIDQIVDAAMNGHKFKQN